MPVPLTVMVDVPASKVRLVVVARFQEVPAPEAVTDEVSNMLKVLVLLLLELNVPIVITWPFISSVPWVKVTVAVEPVVKIPVNFHDPPEPLNVTFPIVLLLPLTFWAVVEVEIKDMADVAALPKVYVSPPKMRALLPDPAVASPIERVIAELWVRVLV